jgi:hypothetical protein
MCAGCRYKALQFGLTCEGWSWFSFYTLKSSRLAARERHVTLVGLFEDEGTAIVRNVVAVYQLTQYNISEDFILELRQFTPHLDFLNSFHATDNLTVK